MVIFIPFLIFAGSVVDNNIKEGKKLLKTGCDKWNVTSMKKGRDLFLSAEKISNGDTWCQYYVAYSDYILTIYYLNSNKKEARAYLKEAESFLDKILNKKDKEARAEAYALYASCLAFEIHLGNGKDGQYFGRKINKYFHQALFLCEKNPRVNLLKGVSLLYTPPTWGGGADQAMPYFRKAIEYFEEEKQTDAKKPGWGKDEAYFYMGQAYRKKGEKEKAVEYVKKSLEVNPNFGHAVKTLAGWALEEHSTQKNK